MGFGEAVGLFFKNYATFNGRSRRAEYWWPSLMFLLAYLAFFIATAGLSGAGDAGALIAGLVGVAFLVFGVAIIIPSIAVSIRRLHDRDMSGWWYLLILVPFGSLVLLIFFVMPGTKGPNKYGPDPKGVPAAETFA
ncbi:MAG: DUF805 domain-containing protein [Pseudomonadota bacterium]